MIGTSMITAERIRQVEQERFTEGHDRRHNTHGELAEAAMCYLAKDAASAPGVPPEWPWDNARYKPSPNRIKNLVRAGALIAAEIDRLLESK